MVENITENMEYDGYKGAWYSVIMDMEFYRVNYKAPMGAPLIYDGNQNLVDALTYTQVIGIMKEYWSNL